MMNARAEPDQSERAISPLCAQLNGSCLVLTKSNSWYRSFANISASRAPSTDIFSYSESSRIARHFETTLVSVGALSAELGSARLGLYKPPQPFYSQLLSGRRGGNISALHCCWVKGEGGWVHVHDMCMRSCISLRTQMHAHTMHTHPMLKLLFSEYLW